MSHTLKHKKPLLNRVRRLKGQLEALERALDEETGCYPILQQITAIRGAINGLMSTVIEGHIREHNFRTETQTVNHGKRMAETKDIKMQTYT